MKFTFDVRYSGHLALLFYAEPIIILLLYSPFELLCLELMTWDTWEPPEPELGLRWSRRSEKFNDSCFDFIDSFDIFYLSSVPIDETGA